MELQAKAAQPAKMEELQVQTTRKRQKRTRLFKNRIRQGNSKASVKQEEPRNHTGLFFLCGVLGSTHGDVYIKIIGILR
ncbi:hypothetical protein D3C81_2219050 [compost metagenome]